MSFRGAAPVDAAEGTAMNGQGFPAARLSRLTLGTAQLGQSYGIANATGMPDAGTAAAILDAAWAGGVTCIDTARHYGAAEERIGRWMAGRGRRPVVISKFPSLGRLGDEDAVSALEAYCRESLKALGVARLDAYLAHDVGDLGRQAIVASLRAMEEAGRIGAFGASAYGPEEVAAALAVDGLALLQAPFSVLDARLAEHGLLDRCGERGILFFARSLFLQGAIFLDPDAFPGHLRALRGPLDRLTALAGEAGISPATLALAAVAGHEGVTSAVVGVDTVDHLRCSLRALGARIPAELATAALHVGAGLEDEVLDPRRWPRGN